MNRTLATLAALGVATSVVLRPDEEELKKHGKNYEFHRYDDAGHGFFYYTRPDRYRVEQALD